MKTSPHISAVVHAHGVASGRYLYHVGWEACRLRNGKIRYGGSGFYESFPLNEDGTPIPALPAYMVGYLYEWVPSRVRTLSPGCHDPLEWHVVASWLNEPIVAINFKASHQ
jgi:hypothetical protein